MTRPDFGKGSVSRRIVCAGLPVLALLAAGGAWAGPPKPNPCEDIQIQSIGNANEEMRIRPGLCRDLGFVPGTAELSASTPPAIANIHKQWSGLKACRPLVSMAVRADTRLAPVIALRQAKQRATALKSALVKSGIPSDKVIVHPLSSGDKAMDLSCPPVD